MVPKKGEKKKGKFLIAGIVFGLLILGVLYLLAPSETNRPDLVLQTPEKQTKAEEISKTIPTKEPETVQGDIEMLPEIDYQQLTQDPELQDLMISRKNSLGIRKSLDLIVQSNESFKIGDVHISMRDILEDAFIQEGTVFEEKIDPSGAVVPAKVRFFGIYVVQPGDNIWNIHFNILKEYYESKGINVSPRADEPTRQGRSSGVGKILKFSETMVIIYNLLDRKMDTDIDLIEPLSKIVVYNMDEVFALLQDIRFDEINRIQFDGKTIWVPSKKL